MKAIASGSAAAESDGSAVGGTAAGVGVAVAMNVARVLTSALIGAAQFSAAALEAIATSAPRLVAESNEYRTKAISEPVGRASSGGAGALAVNIPTFRTVAAIAPGRLR